MTDLTPWQRLRIEQIRYINNLPRSPITHPLWLIIAILIVFAVSFCSFQTNTRQVCPSARGLSYDPALVEKLCR